MLLFAVFPGDPWRPSNFVSSKLLLSDARARVELHTMRGEDGKLYEDWLWEDVTDQINVLPYILATPPRPTPVAPFNKYRGGKFRLFRQNKYGMVEESLAVTGGQVEMARRETPLEAAKREVSRSTTANNSIEHSLTYNRVSSLAVGRRDVADWCRS